MVPFCKLIYGMTLVFISRFYVANLITVLSHVAVTSLAAFVLFIYLLVQH